MKSCGGYRGCFDLDDEGITKRLAVLTIHKNELENLKNYGMYYLLMEHMPNYS